MARITLDLSVDVERAAAYLSDPANRPEWQSSLRAVADLVPGPDGPDGVGTAWTDVTVVPGVRPRMRTTRADTADTADTGDSGGATRHWAEAGDFGPFRATLALALTKSASGTRVEADFEVHGAGLGRLLTALAVPAVRSDLRRAAARLATRR
ncbi:SRPBCC family protein [Nocardioides sp. YIM 152588]|uniref:SRPBCC family protein n=1 Tax=Nocardioides sp. YIM 152588 TaxID=3158259 RepID=UPI0032E38C34